VEKILAKRKRHGRTEYRVKWEGFDDIDNTWEPLSNLTSCSELLTEFERNQTKSPAQRKGKRKSEESLNSQEKETSPQITFKGIVKLLKKDEEEQEKGEKSEQPALDKIELLSPKAGAIPPPSHHFRKQTEEETPHKRPRLESANKTSTLLTERQKEVLLLSRPSRADYSTLDPDSSLSPPHDLVSQDNTESVEALHPFASLSDVHKISVPSPKKTGWSRVPITPKRLFEKEEDPPLEATSALDSLSKMDLRNVSSKSLLKIQEQLSHIMVNITKSLSEKTRDS